MRRQQQSSDVSHSFFTMRSSRKLNYVCRCLLLFALVLVTHATSTAPSPPKPIITVVAPYTIYEHSEYTVSISVDPIRLQREEPGIQHDLPIVLRLSIGIDASDVISFSTIDVLRDVSISVGALPKDREPYHLEVKAYSSSGGLKKPLIPFFHRKKGLHVVRKTYSVYSYTDRAAYKPGDLVQFRVLALDLYLYPVSITLYSIEIWDTDQNVVKLWSNVTLNEFGFFSESIQLSGESKLGNWYLRVYGPASKTHHADTILSSHKFQILEFITPKFDVQIGLSRPYLTFENGRILASIKSLYTHGAPVQGNVNVSVELVQDSSSWGSYQLGSVTMKSAILHSGKADVEFDVFKDLDEEWEKMETDRKINITAIVREELTGVEYTESIVVKMYQAPFLIQVINLQESYWLDGPPIQVIVLVTTPDGLTPVPPSPIFITYKAILKSGSNSHELKSTTTQGKALFLVPPSEELPQQFDISFKYMKQTFDFPERISTGAATAHQKNDPAIFTIQRMADSNVNTTSTKFHVTTPAHSNVTLNCLLVTGRRILSSGRRTFQTLTNLTTKPHFRIDLTALSGDDVSIGEAVQLIVYTAAKDKFHTEVFELGTQQQHKGLDLQLSTSTSEPGDNITMSLTSSLGSLIAYRAIDQSMLLLDEDGELDSDTLAEISYQLAKTQGSLKEKSGHNHHDPFTSANLVLMTNAVECFSNNDCRPDLSETCVEQRCVGWCTEECFGRFCTIFCQDSEGILPDKPDIMPPSTHRPYPFPYPTLPPAPETYYPNRVRRRFPDTWLWDVVRQNSSFPVTLNLTVPDTLTSWIFSAFALRRGQPLALGDRRGLTVTRPFFVTINVPHSVVTWEKVAVQALIHNYLGQDVVAEVIMSNKEGDFQFLSPNASSDVWLQRVSIPADEVRSVFFKISPLVFGTIELEVRARCALAGDALIHRLVVRPPGVKKVKNKAILVRLDPQASKNSLTSSETMTTIVAEFPQRRVPGADSVTLAIVGDLLGPTLSNLDNLLQLPTGSGEQNMVHFVPDIIVLKYLTAVGALTPAIRAKAIRFLKTGYTRELKYAHDDGSFSSFGPSDLAGSTWLTAFVVRSLHAAKEYITVDQAVIDKALEFIVSRQKQDGSFEEFQQVICRDTIGGLNSSSQALIQTAYALLAILEAGNEQHRQTVRLGLQFLVAVANRRSLDTYALTLVTYVLHLASHPKKAEFVKKLEEIAVVDGQGELMHWESSSDYQQDTFSKRRRKRYHISDESRAVDVEMTAYALLTYIQAGRVADALPIVKWLVAQRNPEGGFISTQDTVVALTALGAYAEETVAAGGRGGTQLEITARTRGQDSSSSSRSAPNTVQATVNEDNAIVLQQFQLQQDTRSVDFTVKGHGLALVQLTNTFWVQGTDAAGPDRTHEAAFKVAVKVDGHGKRFKLHICTHATRPEFGNSMTIMEVNLPTGFIVDQDQGHLNQAVQSMQGAKRHELSNDDSTVNIYLDSLPAPRQLPACVTLTADLIYRVTEHAAAYVHVYDYYDPEKRGIATYSPPQVLTFCANDEDENSIGCV